MTTAHRLYDQRWFRTLLGGLIYGAVIYGVYRLAIRLTPGFDSADLALDVGIVACIAFWAGRSM